MRTSLESSLPWARISAAWRTKQELLTARSLLLNVIKLVALASGKNQRERVHPVTDALFL